MQPETRLADPDGDLLLILNPNDACPAPDDPPTSDNDNPKKEIRMLVSSKHMALVSPFFKTMLQNSNFKEGSELNSTGKVEIPLPDDDPEAMTILVNIVHYQLRQVPLKIDFNLATKIALLVDKYAMYQVIGLFADLWMPHLTFDFATKNYKDLHRWIFIVYVFERPNEFQEVTRSLTIKGNAENVQLTVELATPTSICGIVDRGHGRLETKVTRSIIVFSRDNYPSLLLPQSIVLSS